MTATGIIVFVSCLVVGFLMDYYRNKKRKQKVVKRDYDPTEDFYHPN